jgi:signal peptidase I
MAHQKTDGSKSEQSKLSPEERRAAEARALANRGGRETVESLVVAIILALLFRAFVAEAFVIPTGSMAPTLMGSHKDLFCAQCGINYQTGASIENPDEDAANRPGGRSVSGELVVGSVCPNCRSENPIDFNDPNQSTFSGDRILVSKFLYALAEPQRWDVFVFLQPYNFKQPFIKRLVGLPGESLRIRHGDVYARRPNERDWSILRKPHDKQLAMAQLVYDTRFPAKDLVKAGWPERWQPWQPGAAAPPKDSWRLAGAERGSAFAELKQPVGDRIEWLRYFHRLPLRAEWREARSGGSLSAVDPYRTRAVTDFNAYNAELLMSDDLLFDRQGRLNWDVAKLAQAFEGGSAVSRGYWGGGFNGDHWVGDLMLDVELEVDQGAGGKAYVELVEGGGQFRCTFDLTTGQATLSIRYGDRLLPFDGGATEVQAETAVAQGRRSRVRLANFDDQLALWVDDRPIVFAGPTTYTPATWEDAEIDTGPRWTPEDPLDGAPAGVGLQRATGRVNWLQLSRDLYYIAAKGDGFGYGGAIYDYGTGREYGKGREVGQREQIFGAPGLWNDSGLWDLRQSVEFTLDADQFFPLGDNSAASSDARIWYGRQHVDRNLLKGKALAVFWPHYWRRPIPFWPNFQRMGLIR